MRSTWKSDSSQVLRTGDLRLGSNLFHYGVLVVVAGHFLGFLVPDAWIDWAISPTQHQLLAMVTGGVAGLIALIGMAFLLGLLTLPFSAQHMDGREFLTLVSYVKGIVTFHPGVADLLIGTPIIYRLHIFLGFTIFLVSPFTRMVHIWSGVGSLAYALRPYQLVRSRRKPARP